MYRDIPMSQRLERIGEILAKGVYLHMKKEKEAKCLKEKEKEKVQNIQELLPAEKINK